MSEFHLRPLTRPDLPAVLEMERTILDEPITMVTMERELENPIALYLVACPGSAEDVTFASPEPILGYLGVWFIVDEAHIISVAVWPEARRQGVASALVLAALLVAIDRHATTMTLEVRASNVAAQALYAKFGFSKLGVRRGYYPDNHEDAWLLTLEGLGEPGFRERLEAQASAS
ncbi:MAG: ribosomal protein S18-alanine N-acetyltransferase [Chloroflexota bacterium]